MKEENETRQKNRTGFVRNVAGITRNIYTLPVALLLLILITSGCSNRPDFEFHEGERIAIIGNSLADRMQHDGWLETYIQSQNPDKQLVFRNLAFTGDQIAYRPRAHENFGTPDSHLTNVRANVIFAFFGYNESFADNPDEFRNDVSEWIDHTRTQQYDGENIPRIVLFSPIAHENLTTHNVPDGAENNRRLEEYTAVMADVAAEKEVMYVDLFNASQDLYEENEEFLTINGVHLGTEGNRQIARVITEALSGRAPQTPDSELASLREAVLDRNWLWHNKYRATSGNDIWGSRRVLHGNRETLIHELEMIDIMTQNRDTLIWVRAQGQDYDVDDSNVPSSQPVESNFTGGDVTFLGGEEAIDEMTVLDGLDVNLFASEEMFPELINPVQMQVDPQGRIWVAAWGTYPKWEPMTEMNDQLLILEDTDGDGVADESTTFAYVHNPTGFEFWNGGVIVVSAPDILFLKDTDGDGQADVRVRLMGAIDSMDTHHTANNVIYGPDGFIYYQRGVFHLSNIETPWRQNNISTESGLYRFNPRTHEFAFHVANDPNPHGISFDRWGYHYITDATSGSPFQVYLGENGFEKRRLFQQSVRPVAGNFILSSEHLPEYLQNNFLVFNTIGFQGAKRYELVYEEGVVHGEELEDLIYSDDPNFRPTSGAIGNDGAFYIADWHNPTVGHMQHNLRDPIRDEAHGRIYRITAAGEPLQEPVSIAGEPIEDLLELLRHPVNSIRHRVRIELSGRETEDVIETAQSWVQQFDPQNPEHAHPMLEILWLHQQHNVVNRTLLNQLLSSPVEHARIAAERVEWFWQGREDTDLDEISGTLTPPAQQESSPPDNSRTGMTIDLTDDAVASLTIKSVVEEMRFDVEKFIVNVEQPVLLTFDNPDYMPHNLLITEPGAADEIAEQAAGMGAAGFDHHFIPDNPKILHSTRLINKDEAEILEFNAPATPGDYPFVCSFPGHGTLMRGVMSVQA